MTRNVFIFLGTFVVGALIALVARAARFSPHTGHEGHPAKADYAPMVTNTLAPAQPAAKRDTTAQPAASDPHAGHGAAAKPAPASDQPVNTVCAICGMDIDPKVPTLEYQGRKIGFGCTMCPPKFKADPDKYGPYYLRNEVIKN